MSPAAVADTLRAHSHEGRGPCDAGWAFLGAVAAELHLPPSAVQQLGE